MSISDLIMISLCGSAAILVLLLWLVGFTTAAVLTMNAAGVAVLVYTLYSKKTP